MRKFLSFLLLTVASTMACQALTADVTPGQLSQALDGDTTITQLVLTGSMDARDFQFISQNLNHLTTLDLSQVTVVPYSNSTPVYGTYVNYLGNEIPRTAFFGKPLTSVILPENIEGIGYAAFAGCDQLQSVVMPASVTYIEDFAFAGSGLTSVDLPSTVIYMGRGVFSRCEALTSVTVNASTIGSFAFLGDIALAQVNIGPHVSYINEGAFNGCTALTTVQFDPQCRLARIGDEAFINSGLESLDIKSIGLSAIGDWALSQTRLSSIALTDGLNTLGMGALAHNPQLTSVVLPGVGHLSSDDGRTNVTPGEPTGLIRPRANIIPRPSLSLARIGAYAFADDSLLDVSTLIKRGVRVIEPYAFYNNSLEMDTVFLPLTLDFIGDSAMAGMTGMRVLKTAAQEVPEVGLGVWAGVNQSQIPLITPSQEADAQYQEADQWMYFYFAPSFLLGDVNMDGIVNIADITSLIDYLLNGQSDGVDTLASDVDQDGDVGIADVTALVDRILTKSASISIGKTRAEIEKRFASTGDALSLEPVALKPGEMRTMDVMLNNDENDYIAMQCEIVLPAGVELVDVQTLDRARHHSCYLRKNAVEENAYTLMSISSGNTQFEGNQGKLLRLTVLASDDFDGASALVKLSNIMLVTDRSAVMLAGNTTSTLNESTAVEQLNADKQVARVTYVNVSGQHSDKPFDGLNIVVTSYTDGTTMTTKVIK